MSLTGKQARFVEEYLIDLNATKAAIRAGYSEKTAYSIGEENLKKPDIQQAIQEATNNRSKRTEINQDWVIQRLAAIADCSMRDVASWGPGGVHYKDSKDLTDAEAYAVKKVKDKRSILSSGTGEAPDMVMNQQLEIEQHDKTKALELIGKHLGMFKDTIQLNGQINTPVVVEFKKPNAES